MFHVEHPTSTGGLGRIAELATPPAFSVTLADRATIPCSGGSGKLSEPLHHPGAVPPYARRA